MGGGRVSLNLTRPPPRCTRAAISMCAGIRRGGEQVKSARVEWGGGGRGERVGVKFHMSFLKLSFDN